VSSESLNRLQVLATLVETSGVRFTPAGVPAVDVVLEHASEQVEAGQVRQATLRIRAVAFGPVAEALSGQALGSQWACEGFLTNSRNGKGVVFHIQAFKPL
jgi:primosomal replication protein N